MRTIRYDDMIIGGSNQCSTLKLSDCGSHQGKEITTCELGKMMLDKSDSWVIEGDEPIKWTYSLYELLSFIKSENGKAFVHLKTNNYDYYFLRSTSITDEILDMCDVLTDKRHNSIDLRAMISGNDIVYWRS